MRHTGVLSVRVTTFSVFISSHSCTSPYVQFIIIISVDSHALVCARFDSAESVNHANVCVFLYIKCIVDVDGDGGGDSGGGHSNKNKNPYYYYVRRWRVLSADEENGQRKTRRNKKYFKFQMKKEKKQKQQQILSRSIRACFAQSPSPSHIE